LVTVPATTGPKSHDTGPELLLIELLGGGPVCAETDGASCSNSTSAATQSKLTKLTHPADRTIRID
jgi:hypothetical protein